MTKVGIISGSGIASGELMRCLLQHPNCKIEFVTSETQFEKKITDVHMDLFELSHLKFCNKIDNSVDIIFMCGGHGNTKQLLEKFAIPYRIKVIDLSQDFRLHHTANYENRNFVYGLPEINKLSISTSNSIANPGCFATAIQLALLPLAFNKLIKSEIHMHAITGSTGAGNRLQSSTAFNYRNNNVSAYKIFSHQHLNEIKETLSKIQNNSIEKINFIPLRGNFTRGIFSTIYLTADTSLDELQVMYNTFYSESPFVKIVSSDLDLKQVTNTNYCFLKIDHIQNKIVITSVIDNLIKGAAGQAIQNMNIMFGYDETAGLKFKANTY